MKFTIDLPLLKAVVSKLGLAIHNQTILPILENILAKVEKGKVHFTTSNALITVSYQAECFTEGEEGTFLIPFSKIKSIIGVIHGELTIEYKNDSVYAITDTDNWCLGKAGKAEDFPKMATVADKNKFNIGREFIPSLAMAALGVSTDATRQAMCSICVEIQPKEMVVTSTDAHSLYSRKLIVDLPITENVQLLLPVEFAKALDGFEGARIGYNSKHISIESGPLSISCKRIDASFPNWRAIVPAVHDGNLSVKLTELDEAIAKAMIIAENVSHKGIDFIPMGDTIELHTIMPDTGMSAKCVLQGTSTTPVEKIRFNGRLLKRMIKQLMGHGKHDDSVDFCITNALKASTIRLQGLDDVTVLIMPVSLN
jgi:DNA polymerase III sliding clamp (beta) subunit (PCNA family)